MTDVKKKLMLSIMQFLADQLQDSQTSPEAKESLEVAIQCLESAYGVSPGDPQSAPLRVPRTLVDIFSDYLRQNVVHVGEPTEAMRAEAERLKNEGNNLMKSDKFQDALVCYSAAINIDGKNAVYYCNRAAAYSKLNDHVSSISDCNYAIQIDPQYSKAYARMGLAYANLSEHKKARDAYKRALELDPENESYQNNLKVAESDLKDHERSDSSSTPQPGGMPNLGAGLDLGSLLNNSVMRDMCRVLMQDPEFGNIGMNFAQGAGGMEDLVSRFGSMAQGGASMDALLTAGQQLAAQMQASNPELVENLRRQMNNNPGNESTSQNSENNPDAPSNP